MPNNKTRFKKIFVVILFVLFLTNIILQKRESHFVTESLYIHLMRKKKGKYLYAFMLNTK